MDDPDPIESSDDFEGCEDEDRDFVEDNEDEDFEGEDREFSNDCSDDAEVLASAGFGTDEDYGGASDIDFDE